MISFGHGWLESGVPTVERYVPLEAVVPHGSRMGRVGLVCDLDL